MKENIKTAFESAEQEIQEKEIAQLKSIIKDLLQKKVDKEEEKREIEKEISVIKQTIDDFKAGRLDKVKELQEKDSIANFLPFRIMIINQPQVIKPWGWDYTISTPRGNSTWSGNCVSTFTSGTYVLGDGKIINL